MKKIHRRGLMFILSSPSGAGKTTLAKLLLSSDKHLKTSISYTTRAQRLGEQEGKDYHFVSEEEFDAMVENGEFMEHATIFGHKYGTPRKFVENCIASGEDVLFDIEWQGNRRLSALYREDVVSVFIFPPSKMELLNRLRNRKQDSEEVIRYRMEMADEEISHWSEYDYIILNKNLDGSLRKLLSILRAERLKKARRTGLKAFADSLIAQKIEL